MARGDVHVGGIAEDGYLEDGRDDEGHPAFFVPEHGQQFLFDEGGYSNEEVHGFIRGIWGLSAGDAHEHHGKDAQRDAARE